MEKKRRSKAASFYLALFKRNVVFSIVDCSDSGDSREKSES